MSSGFIEFHHRSLHCRWLRDFMIPAPRASSPVTKSSENDDRRCECSTMTRSRRLLPSQLDTTLDVLPVAAVRVFLTKTDDNAIS